jgi:hypothetical protein
MTNDGVVRSLRDLQRRLYALHLLRYALAEPREE